MYPKETAIELKAGERGGSPQGPKQDGVNREGTRIGGEAYLSFIDLSSEVHIRPLQQKCEDGG